MKAMIINVRLSKVPSSISCEINQTDHSVGKSASLDSDSISSLNSFDFTSQLESKSDQLQEPTAKMMQLEQSHPALFKIFTYWVDIQVLIQ